ncbi:MAG: hypothetical protein JST32_23215, partial [Bacteroidetes bacterium]|nr:hypothetical protein [Bacteroidota bacterium]
MKKILYSILLLLAGRGAVFGQGSNKLQISIEYSHGIFSNFTGDTYKETSNLGGSGFSDTIGKNMSHQLNGFDVSGAYRLSDHFAAKASFGWLTGSATTDIPGGSFGRGSAAQPTYVLVVPSYGGQHTRQSDLSVAAGIEYRDFKSPGKLKPFGQLMIGFGFEKASSNLTSSTHTIIYQGQNLKVNATAFNIDAGAGLDLKLSKNFDLRIIQVDFAPAFPFKTDIQKTGDLRGPFPFTSFPNDRLYTLQTVTTNNGFQVNF